MYSKPILRQGVPLKLGSSWGNYSMLLHLGHYISPQCYLEYICLTLVVSILSERSGSIFWKHYPHYFLHFPEQIWPSITGRDNKPGKSCLPRVYSQPHWCLKESKGWISCIVWIHHQFSVVFGNLHNSAPQQDQHLQSKAIQGVHLPRIWGLFPHILLGVFRLLHISQSTISRGLCKLIMHTYQCIPSMSQVFSHLLPSS